MANGAAPGSDDHSQAIPENESSESESEDSEDVLPIPPICQVEDCEMLATETIPSEYGHPNHEWKLCAEHYQEVNGDDPWHHFEQGWSLRKLYYRCPESGKISHNTLLKQDDVYSCQCNNKHVPASVTSDFENMENRSSSEMPSDEFSA